MTIIPTNWESNKSIIKVIGVGGGGTNAVSRMYQEGIRNVDFLVCNTDRQSLSRSSVPDKLQLGGILTKGLGAGCNPDIGRNAAIESIDAIKEKIGENTEMVFITAGMGGGTGTGAAPIIAKVAKEMGLLVIGVITQPFKDEGAESLQRAYEGTVELSKNVDSLLIIDNDKIYDIYGDLQVREAFRKADDVLNTAVKGIAEIITYEGFVNVDFADIKAIMKDSGMAIMGLGEASGPDRAIVAVENAFSSPLLKEFDLKTARSSIVNITTNEDNGITVSELQLIMDYIKEYTGSSSSFKRGIVFDKNMDGDKIVLTIVATGFKMHILPPPSIAASTNEEDILILSTTTNNEEVILTGSDIDEGSRLSPFDLSVISIYTPEINISDYENETAYARRKKLIAEKK